MKKVILALFVVVFCVVSIEAGWWDKIIKRMMSEGISRVDSSWDDAHAALMGIDAYYLYPKSFTAHYDFNMDGQKYMTYITSTRVDVSEDVAGKYGPIDFQRCVKLFLAFLVAKDDGRW